MNRRVAVLGGRTGLLGVPLTKAFEAAGFETEPVGRADFDICDSEAMSSFLDEYQPDWLVNAVAYTAVDKAEEEPAEAARLNKSLPAMLGRLCASRGVGLFHYSTDFVFDGRKTTPYTEEDPTGPTGVYGQTKLDGEKALASLGYERMIVARVAWLFGPGKKNFVTTMLGLAKDRETLNVVADQIGCPTSTLDLAEWSADVAVTAANGIIHAVGGGQASWCELAAAAVATANLPCRVLPIPSQAYPQKAKRPSYSVLDTGKLARAIGRSPRPWREAVRDYVAMLTTSAS